MKSKNDFSKTISIQEMQETVNLKETVKFNAQLMQANEVLTQKLLEAEDKVRHLENLLTKHVPILGNPSIFLRPAEEHIIEKQIEMMLDQALTRPMTLDEVKKFDLLIKNKKLLTQKEKESRDVFPQDLTPEETMQIAERPMISDVNEDDQ